MSMQNGHSAMHKSPSFMLASFAWDACEGVGVMMKYVGTVIFCLSLALLAGCSATSLRCGVDGDSSFVELYNFPQSITRETQRMADLCGFAYEGTEVQGVLKIEDASKND